MYGISVKHQNKYESLQGDKSETVQNRGIVAFNNYPVRNGKRSKNHG